jgi:hypothetical protein
MSAVRSRQHPPTQSSHRISVGYISGYLGTEGYPLLTETAIRSAKPKEKAYKLFDGRGLFLLVAAAGGRLSSPIDTRSCYS